MDTVVAASSSSAVVTIVDTRRLENVEHDDLTITSEQFQQFYARRLQQLDESEKRLAAINDDDTRLIDTLRRQMVCDCVIV